MHKKTLSLSIICFSLLSSFLQGVTADKSLWYGTIKFPQEMHSIPPVRVYYTGNKIPTEIDNDARQITFALSEYTTRTVFYLVIVDTIDFDTQQNTITCLKVPAGRPYKVYQLTFKPNSQIIRGNQLDAQLSQRGSWDIVQMRLADDLRIPDNAIIVCYHAYLVKSVEGGNALELPKIILDNEILSKLTVDELHDASIQFLLSCLNCDSFHTLPDAQIKADFQHKTIIALTT